MNIWNEGINKDILDKNKKVFFINEERIDEQEDTWRHTWLQESNLMNAIREGQSDAAIENCRLMDQDSGRLAKKEIEHWKRLVIIGISLSARAAIEGGLPPKDAYRISGYYITSVDNYKDAESLLEMRDTALRDLADNVKKRIGQKKHSPYTKKCMDYIEKNYRNKIYLEEIAEKLEISPSYLSRTFKNETGETVKNYLTKVRIDHAGNLLKYSNESLSDIAAYVNFPSQSYFCRIFKKLTGISPKAYRDENKTDKWMS